MKDDFDFVELASLLSEHGKSFMEEMQATFRSYPLAILFNEYGLPKQTVSVFCKNKNPNPTWGTFLSFAEVYRSIKEKPPSEIDLLKSEIESLKRMKKPK
jgi:hypothetical protein